MPQIPSATQAIEKEDNLLRDQGIAEVEYDPDYFQEVYIECQNVQVAPDQESLARPMYWDPKSNVYFDVENLALRYSSMHHKLNGMHCENSLGRTYFGLLMWNLIFDDTVPYVFQSPYQS